MKEVERTRTPLPYLSAEAIAHELFHSAEVLIWLYDNDLNGLYFNNYWYEFTGSNQKRDNAKGWLERFDQDDIAEFISKHQHAQENKTTFSFKLNLKTVSGKIHWISGSSKPYFLKKEFIGYCCSAVEIHEISGSIEEETLRRTNELRNKHRELEHKNQLIEAVLDSTISMISVVNRDFKIVTFNHKAEEYLHTEKEKVIGRNVFEVFPYLKNTTYKDKVEKAMQGELVHSHISESALQKGRYFETFFIPLKGLSGTIDGVIVKVRDRTEDILLQHKLIENNSLLELQNRELKRQTDFIESLFDSTVDVIVVFDKAYRFISMNRKCEEKYGFKREEMIGKNLLDIFPMLKNSGVHRDLKRAFSGEFVYDLSYTSFLLTKTHLQNYYVPLFDEQEDVYAVMVIGHDITELVEANDKLRISNETLADKITELQRSNQDLEQFAYVASHDLQEPIRKIATYTDKLLTRSKEKLGDETKLYLERISKSTNRMYELINGLLLYSRITREGNLFTQTSLDVIIKQVLADFELKIQQQNAVVSCQRMPVLEAIPVQVNQMFTNLISNSLKFAKKDVKPVIQIAASDLTDEQKNFYNLNPKAHYVNIFYLDNGIGFEQQYADRIFELFQRLHDRSSYPGSGIGLAICKKIVNNHNGQIYVFSEPDKGATFQIIMPYRQKPFSQ